jgi:hypothetical protein
MATAVLIMAVLLPMMMAAMFLLARHLYRRPQGGEELSPVSRQHIEIFPSGHINQHQVEAAKVHFRDLLEQGDERAVEASLRPGIQYVVQVRALAELGTDTAGRILERQLQRRLSEDQLEQAWYWVDLASGLRSLNRSESLPHLLRCSEAARDVALGHFFAAETICFLGFAGYLREPQSALGGLALRVLHRALEGLRYGVQPYLIVEARLGEMVESLWDHRPETVHPLIVCVLAETVRLIQRAAHAQVALADDGAEQEAFALQMSRLQALEPVLSDYLQDAPERLCAALPTARGEAIRDILHALNELHAEAAQAILPLLQRPGFPEPELAVEVLTWSRRKEVGPRLCAWMSRQVAMSRRAQSRRRAIAPRKPSVPSDVPYHAVLRALRGHPSADTEGFLLQATRDWDPTYRAAAVSSLGWWEPMRRGDVTETLENGRRDPNPDVRQAARCALARLGERQALHWFRQALTGEDPQRIHEAVQTVASECLTLLWPDLDRLADAEDSDVAQHAREAIERLSEDMEYRRTW